jgi:predicted permease
MSGLAGDFRFALRLWRHRPVFTAVALLSLALGIGANTAIFSVMDALVLRMLPVRQPEQLVLFGAGRAMGIFDSFPDGAVELFSPPFFEHARQHNQVFSDITAVESMSADVHARIAGPSAELEPLKIRLVSGNYFTLLGVGAAAGRVLTPEDDGKPGANPVAVMSHAMWQRRFPNDTGVIGRTLTFNRTAFTIIGVASREFFGTMVDESPDLWIPLAMQAQVQPWLDDPRGTLSQSLWLMGRLKTGVSTASAQANTNVLYQQWLHQVAGTPPSPERVLAMQKARVDLSPAASGLSTLRIRFSQPLRILMVLVGLVLLIACVNIANLLLAQAAGRQREIAVRLALGADRRRLIGQLLSESLLLALIGGAAGVLIAWWGGQLLLVMVHSGPDPLPLQVGPSGRVLLFTLGLSLLTGLLFGIAPALRLTRVDVGPSLKEGKGTARSQSHSRLGQVLVAGQVALALILMIGAGLFVRTLQALQHTDTGFDKGRVVLLQLDSDSSSFKGAELARMRRRVEERIRALPGVQAVSFSLLTYAEGQWVTGLWPEGVPHTEANGKAVDGNRVGVQYFAALGLPVVMGRSFGPQDTPQSQQVAVVNETLARTLYPGASPIGRHFALGERQSLEIVGVVKDAKYVSVREKARGMFYLDTEQEKKPEAYDDLVVRVQGRPEALLTQLRAVIHDEDPNLAIAKVTTLGQKVDDSLRRERLLAQLAGFFGVLALLLASLGLYGVMAYAVARRTNEIGIRMALGAQPGNVLRMVLRESLVVVAVGLAAGIPAALACGRFVASQLYGLQANDGLTIGGASAVLLLVALLASFLPARRAALLDPLAALREE